jgi:hypothetical protein
MLKSLRVPEKLFSLATWGVSVVFASFLIGLGGKIVGDLPGVDERVSLDEFVDSTQAARIRRERDSLVLVQRDRRGATDRAQLSHTAAENAYRARRQSFANWIATRTATTDARQDPEVLARTRELDDLSAAERSAEREVERLNAEMLAVSQAIEARDTERMALVDAARSRYQRARFRQELRVFLIRLALTLPLLVVAGWLLLRKRKSQYWPLARGFVLFALFAFFVELVPYLPSYGGYVRYTVGAIVTALVGIYVIRAMQRYVARRAEVERQSEQDRRRSLAYEEAIRRIGTGVCPGCERAIAVGPGGETANFCVHCGMTLFDTCNACSARKNAFFQYCPSCGVPAGGAEVLATAT